jgi:hypothetical protein
MSLEERGSGEGVRGWEREIAGVTGVEREVKGRESCLNRDENKTSRLLISSPLGSSSMST